MQIPSSLQLLNHPYYRAWECGHLPKESIADYASQYYHHVSAFPRYLSATHAQVDRLEDRQILLHNLMDEELGTENHPELWLRFAEGLGKSRDEVLNGEARDGIRQLIDTFKTLSASSAAEGLGALYAYESQVPAIAKFKKDALKKFYVGENSRALQFFEVHEKADVYHTQSLCEVIEGLSAEDQAKAQKAAEIAAKSLWKFLDSMAESN